MLEQTTFSKVTDALAGSLKLALKYQSPLVHSFSNANNRLVVLGNGPSLKAQMDRLQTLDQFDFLGVNYFACTDAYEKFKPTSYVIASPQYWIKDNQEEWNSTRNKVFQCLIAKTKWECNFFVPVIAKKDKKWVKMMAANSFIKINYINLSPIDGNIAYFKKWMKRFMVCPRPHNVLVPSILCAINMGYKDVYLAGADHSWIPEISVTKNNEVLIAQKHFYGDQHATNSLLSDKAKPMYSPGSQSTFKLHQVLQKFYYSFKSYWILKEYAHMHNCNIYNLLDNSYIDAFPKISFDDISS